MSTETNKQTAIEWLNQQIVDRQNGDGNSKSWDEILEQALAMEKEQIISAIDNFSTNQWGEFLSGEEYYEETYGSKRES